ncbi:hypothetical protein J2X72_001164 [Phyllobacterium sp. 1468]|nr:hypothetical protein [Phyllobacterium sp. 1468]
MDFLVAVMALLGLTTVVLGSIGNTLAKDEVARAEVDQ